MITKLIYLCLFAILFSWSLTCFARDIIETDCETIHPKPQPIPTVIKV